MKNNTTTKNRLLLAAVLLLASIGGDNLQALSIQNQTATNTPTKDTAPIYGIHTLNNGQQVIYESSHPYAQQIIDSIQEAVRYFWLHDPGLVTVPMTYYIFNGKKYSDPGMVLLASEYMEPDAIFFYNPTSSHLLALSKSGDHMTLGAASDGQAGQTPPPNSTLRLTYHELGHVKWSKMTDEQKAVWNETYNLSKDLDLQRPVNTYTRADGSTGVYYDDMGPEEGFCEAFADNLLGPSNGGAELDQIITAFLDYLPPV